MASLQSRISDLITAIGSDVKILRTTSTSSIAAQTLGTSDTYIAGSSPPAFPAGKIQAGTCYRVKLDMAKTAAGVAVATFTLRMGTLGTTSDAAICTFTAPSAQTAAIDNGTVGDLSEFPFCRFWHVCCCRRPVGNATNKHNNRILVYWRFADRTASSYFRRLRFDYGYPDRYLDQRRCLFGLDNTSRTI
jgi:hypothetical protein